VSASAAAANPDDDEPKPMFDGKEFSLSSRTAASTPASSRTCSTTISMRSGASVDLLVADDVYVLARVGLPLDGGRRRGRGGTEADAVVVRQSEFGVAHPVVI